MLLILFLCIRIVLFESLDKFLSMLSCWCKSPETKRGLNPPGWHTRCLQNCPKNRSAWAGCYQDPPRELINKRLPEKGIGLDYILLGPECFYQTYETVRTFCGTQCFVRNSVFFPEDVHSRGSDRHIVLSYAYIRLSCSPCIVCQNVPVQPSEYALHVLVSESYPRPIWHIKSV